MSLADLWFVLFILIVAGYLILDGFDMGVGILHLPLARNDLERRTMVALEMAAPGWAPAGGGASPTATGPGTGAWVSSPSTWNSKMPIFRWSVAWIGAFFTVAPLTCTPLVLFRS